MGQILPSYPYNGPENQNFEKMKKMPGDIILLHMCTINEDHMIYGSWNKVQQAEFFVTLGHFLPVDHWLPQKSKFSKIEKQTWRYYHFLNVHHKWQSYDLWLRYRTRQTLFVILACFLPFHPPDDPKNQNFEKMKATLGDIILQMCTINDNHMMYGSWDMEYDRKKFSLFWTVFCSFTNNPENQNFWKNERNGDLILHMCPINDNHMMYGSWNMEHHGRFCHFGPFCALLPHQQSEKKQNFEKWKKHLKISSLYTCVPQMTIIWCMVLKYGAWQTHFFVILDHFFPFNPTDDHKNQSFEKMIATSGDIIILHMCTINDNHMMDV